MRSKALAICAGAVATVPLITAASASASTPSSPAPVPLAGQCSMITIPVALGAGKPDDQTLAAEYCTPVLPTRTVDVLVAGATYSHVYWDPPVDQGGYSFVRYDLLTGHATLAIDRLGTGASSHPPSTDLTLPVDAYVLHQVITWARQNAGYPQVNVIGHSMGSAIAAMEANEWPSDPSRLVLTGFLNSFAPAPGGPAAILPDIYPAASDPKFAGDSWAENDPGYLTTLPGARAGMFYYPATERRAVVAWDEASKDVVAATELEAIAAGEPSTSSVTAPVLVMDGQKDVIFCEGNVQPDCSSWSAMTAFEKPFFPSAANVTAESLAQTGHDLALSTTAPASFALIAAWLATH